VNLSEQLVGWLFGGTIFFLKRKLVGMGEKEKEQRRMRKRRRGKRVRRKLESEERERERTAVTERGAKERLERAFSRN